MLTEFAVAALPDLASLLGPEPEPRRMVGRWPAVPRWGRD